jgi:hypothetical protein
MTFYANGQKLYESPYQKKMDSLAMANFKFNVIKLNTKSYIYTYRPFYWLKFTLKSRFNNNVTSKIRLDNGISNLFNELEFDDYLSLGSYDVRMKIYLSKSVRFVQTMIVTGIQQQTYTYTSGLIIKF